MVGRKRGKNYPKPLGVEISTIVLFLATPVGDVRNFGWSLLFDLFRYVTLDMIGQTASNCPV
jgi:hypothetical protein